MQFLIQAKCCVCFQLLLIKALCTIKGTLADSLDPDQMLQNTASGQSLYCWH